VEYQLKPETQSDPTVAADVVIAYETLSGLSLGKWVTQLLRFTSYNGTSIFPLPKSHSGTANISVPILQYQYWKGCVLEASQHCEHSRTRLGIASKTRLHPFTPGGEEDVHEFHGHPVTMNEPKPPGTRMAMEQEIYEHGGRWQVKSGAESMPKCYNQWDLSERITPTLHCM
jgi:hypothetical protein